MFLLSIFEFIGTVAFAVSGTLIAIQKKLDLFGILTLAVVTAVGGGIFRDILIGANPPNAFKNPFYCFISILTAIVVIGLYTLISKITYNRIIKEIKFSTSNEDMQRIELKQRIDFLRRRTAILRKINIILDAIGLGVFTAVGANIAISNNFANLFLVICLGSITGIGGGIVRDVFVQDIPMVFKKEIYALASILGGLSFWFLHNYVPRVNALYICSFITFTFRILSVKFNWNLPNLALSRNVAKN